MKSYPLRDRPNKAELVEAKGLGFGVADLRAVATGEKRCPKKGEWYLSGAIVEAYRAPNDLSTAYHIAKLVIVPNE